MADKRRGEPDLEETYRNVRDLVDRLERENTPWHHEKRMIIGLGALALALVGALGIAMVLKGTRDRDLEKLQRCEMDQQVQLVWKEMEALKGKHPELDRAQLTVIVESKRPQFREAAKAYCAAK
jgi:hypothetical protein